MNNVAKLLSNSRLCNYFKSNQQGVIIDSNNAFKNTYSHITPSKVQDICRNLNDLTEAIDKAVNDQGKHIPVYFECRALDGGNMVMSYEVFYAAKALHYIGFHSLDRHEFDEKMFAVLKAEVAKFNKDRDLIKFRINHNFRGSLAKIIGLSSIIREADSLEEMIKIVEMIRGEVNSIDKELHNIINNIL